ncbi:hypothetical protein [Arthrobacter woluwensis]|uniref:hypothetical protein n=1 Tax=Arthrobacter woluwensis TaxID=156980 RepID=UPI0011B284D1|nr:hypothetical protein [Arthrobacter woluwensis]
MAGASNSTLVANRRKALEFARKKQEREQSLLEISEEFFALQEKKDDLYAAAEKKAADVLKKAEERAEQIRSEAGTAALELEKDERPVIRKMLALGVSKSETAKRLGVSPAAIRAAEDTAPVADSEPAAAEPETQHSETPAYA